MSGYVSKIAIVGVSGQIGKHFVDALLKTGKHSITAITREDSDSPIPDGVKVAKVNYDDPSSLVKALEGQDVLIITMSVTAPPDTSKKLVQAAADAKVPLVLPNEFGIDHTDDEVGRDTFLGPRLAEVRSLIISLGVSSYMAIVCSFWYSYSLSFGEPAYGLDIRKKEATFFDDGEKWINSSTWEQCGRAVAALLSLPISAENAPSDYSGAYLNDFKDKEVCISSFKISQRSMLDSILRVTGDKESDWKITNVDSKQRWKKHFDLTASGKGDPTDFARALYTRVFFPDTTGQYDPSANKLLGLEEEDLDEQTKVAVDMALGKK